MNKLAIVGASGHGKVVADLAEVLGYSVVFFDDAYPKQKSIEHWSVIGTFKDLFSAQKKYPNVIVAIGNNNIRFSFGCQLLQANFNLPILIHPSAIVSQYAKISAGTVVFANAVVNAFASIEAHCIINTGAIVEHDCVLGSAVHLSPNAALAGGSVIGDLSWLGIGCVTRQLITIGESVVVGANATVIKDISSHETVVGSPAISIKK